MVTPGDRAQKWAGVVSILVASAIASYGAFFKGEPEAEKSHNANSDVINAHTKLMIELTDRIAYLEGRHGVRELAPRVEKTHRRIRTEKPPAPMSEPTKRDKPKKAIKRRRVRIPHVPRRINDIKQQKL